MTTVVERAAVSPSSTSSVAQAIPVRVPTLDSTALPALLDITVQLEAEPATATLDTTTMPPRQVFAFALPAGGHL